MEDINVVIALRGDEETWVVGPEQFVLSRS